MSNLMSFVAELLVHVLLVNHLTNLGVDVKWSGSNNLGIFFMNQIKRKTFEFTVELKTVFKSIEIDSFY